MQPVCLFSLVNVSLTLVESLHLVLPPLLYIGPLQTLTDDLHDVALELVIAWVEAWKR